MMLYFSIVSHNHFSVVKQLNCLPLLAQLPFVTVVLIDNVEDDQLAQWCVFNGIKYIVNERRLGFGENNNKVFSYISSQSGFDLDRDWFVVLNPDVDLAPEVFNILSSQLNTEHQIYAIDLYKDESGEVSDDSIRNFPSLTDFVSSLLLGVNKTKVDKSLIREPCYVDWAAGSFLVFKASHYQRLGGFDPAYFMYCEDIDICFRSATQFDCKVRYLPQVKARHLAQHGNRKIFSKHFYWHVSSTMRFLWRKYVYLYIKGKRI